MSRSSDYLYNGNTGRYDSQRSRNGGNVSKGQMGVTASGFDDLCDANQQNSRNRDQAVTKTEVIYHNQFGERLYPQETLDYYRRECQEATEQGKQLEFQLSTVLKEKEDLQGKVSCRELKICQLEQKIQDEAFQSEENQKALEKDYLEQIASQRKLIEKLQAEAQLGPLRNNAEEQLMDSSKYMHSLQEGNVPSWYKGATANESDRAHIQGIMHQLNTAINNVFEKHTHSVQDNTEVIELKHQNAQLRKEFDDLKYTHQSLEKDSLEVITRIKDEMTALKKENEDLSVRLSSEMNMKVSSDETSIENISIKNRPMNIAEEYRTLCSNQWVDVKGVLDEVCGRYRSYKVTEEDKHQFLCDIILHAQERTRQIQHETAVNVLKILQNPMLPLYSVKNVKGEEDIPVYLANAIGDYLRCFGKDVDLSKITKEIDRKLSDFNGNISVCIYNNNPKLKDYITATVQLAWKMANQRPQMSFGMPGENEEFQDAFQEIGWGSDDPRGVTTVVKSYIYPVLYQGDNVMVKGKVVLRKATHLVGGTTYDHFDA